MSAEKTLLETLHDELAKSLLAKIKSGEATAADLGVARQFLNDNGIEALPVEGTSMGDLLEQIDVENVIRLEDKIGSR